MEVVSILTGGNSRSGVGWEQLAFNGPTYLIADLSGAYIVDGLSQLHDLATGERVGGCPSAGFFQAAALDGRVVLLEIEPQGSIICTVGLAAGPDTPGVESELLQNASRVARVGEELWLLGPDNLRYDEGEWLPVDWGVEVADGWAANEDEVWFVGDFGIARFDGEVFEVVESAEVE